MLLDVQAVPPFFKNGFVLGCEDTRQGVIIDPGDEVDLLIDFVARERLAIRFILLTHAHVDHITGVKRTKDVLQVPVGLHPDDNLLYEGAATQGLLYGLTVETQPPVDFFYRNGDSYRFGSYEAVVHHTPGHSPGGVCLQVGRPGKGGRDLFVGDTLFAGSIGRTDLPGGDYATLMRSIKEVLFSFGDEAVVYPGHGPATTIGAERRCNPFLAGV